MGFYSDPGIQSTHFGIGGGRVKPARYMVIAHISRGFTLTPAFFALTPAFFALAPAFFALTPAFKADG